MADSAEGSPQEKRRFRNAVIGMGIGQLYAWGVIYYPFSVTGKTMAADLGMSTEAAFAGYSAMLVVGALFAPWAGRVIDRRGGRPTMALGALFGAGALVSAASATGPVSFYLACILLGMASAVALYDAGFAAIVQVTGVNGRRAITYVTFLGGFASTAFWPITAFLMERWGWRTTYLIFAAGMAAICLPIYLATLGAPADTPQGAGGAPVSHPDDETLATGVALSTLVRQGHEVHVLTCTLGEEGEVIPADLAHLALGPELALEAASEIDLAGAQALVLSACVQMPAAAAIDAAEQKFGLPVVTASSCTVRQMLKALDLDPVVPGFGAALSLQNV